MTLQVERVARAEQYLETRWPGRRGRFHAAALEACRAAIEGRLRPQQARMAFEAAAREADILLPPPPPAGVFGRRNN